MPSPLSVSVILTTYNCARHLPFALASWARQTHTALEVLVVDDGSTDGTMAVLAEWQGRLTLRALRIDHHHGRGAARNRAIRAADGDILLLADDDVLVEPDFVAKVATGGCVVGRRSGLMHEWLRHLPATTVPRLGGLMTRRPDFGAELMPERRELFTLADLEQRFEATLAEFTVEDQLWERLAPLAALPGPQPLGWLLAMAAPLAVPRRPLFEAGLCDEADHGRDLELPELAYRLQRAGAGFTVADAQAWRLVRPFASWPLCAFTGLGRFFARHDPIDTWLLLRFLTGEPVAELNELAGARRGDTRTESQLAMLARELVPQLIAGLRVWWHREETLS